MHEIIILSRQFEINSKMLAQAILALELSKFIHSGTLLNSDVLKAGEVAGVLNVTNAVELKRLVMRFQRSLGLGDRRSFERSEVGKGYGLLLLAGGGLKDLSSESISGGYGTGDVFEEPSMELSLAKVVSRDREDPTNVIALNVPLVSMTPRRIVLPHIPKEPHVSILRNAQNVLVPPRRIMRIR
jgi:hypothetical protein